MPTARFTLEELTQWGEALGARLRPSAVLTLAGELGAGKTTLVQAICRGYGVGEPVTSPTFALVHEYRAARSPVLHLDLYRLNGPGQLANIGWDDALASGALVLVEWPDRAAGALPIGTQAITMSHIPGEPGLRSVSW